MGPADQRLEVIGTGHISGSSVGLVVERLTINKECMGSTSPKAEIILCCALTRRIRITPPFQQN